MSYPFLSVLGMPAIQPEDSPVESALTPIRTHENIVVKMEAFNMAGSHKSRAARFMVQDAVDRGLLQPGGSRRILEKTGGNLGVGLAYAASKLDIGVDLVVGRSFSRVKRALCEAFGARLAGEDLLDRGLQPKDVIAHLLANDGDSYLFLDQFNNRANYQAHLVETGPEIVLQIDALCLDPARPLILVCGAGTGASFGGISAALAAEYRPFTGVLVLPEGSDLDKGVFPTHALEGIAVGVTPPFLDRSRVDRIIYVSNDQARRGQSRMAASIGYYPGMSSGANFHAAELIARENPNAIVVTIAYDNGEAYLANLLLPPAASNASHNVAPERPLSQPFHDAVRA
jgi:cysteine synthase